MISEFEIKIDKGITDEQVMEYCLNLKCSGYDPNLLIAFFGLGRKWKFDKLLYLYELLEITETTGDSK